MTNENIIEKKTRIKKDITKKKDQKNAQRQERRQNNCEKIKEKEKEKYLMLKEEEKIQIHTKQLKTL